MNKQELIKRIEVLPYTEGPIADTITINRNWILESIEQLDEPQKVKIPQFVADWLKENDLREETLGEQSIFDAVDNLAHGSKNGYYSDVKRWIDENGDLFARAWLDGYEVEKEKRYRISMPKARNYKNHAQFLCEKDGKMFWCAEWYSRRTKFTRKELEEADFGWVFDCPGIEIEEVE